MKSGLIVCIESTSLPRAGCNTRLIFMWNSAGFNSEFSAVENSNCISAEG